jgi:tetratricopeptide (TPR) repeat protein
MRARKRGFQLSALSFQLLLVGCAAPQREAPAPKPVKDVSPLEKQFAESPDDPKVNLELGDRSMAGGDWLRAEQYYARAEALGTPQGTVVPRVVRVLVLARRYDEALDRCHRRLSKAPEDRATRMVEAAILEALERPREAEHDLNVLVHTRPNDPHPYLALGKLYRDSYHDAIRAREMFEKYLALAPKSEESEALRYQLEESAADPVPPPPAPPAATTAPATPTAPTAPTTPTTQPTPEPKP